YASRLHLKPPHGCRDDSDRSLLQACAPTACIPRHAWTCGPVRRGRSMRGKRAEDRSGVNASHHATWRRALVRAALRAAAERPAAPFVLAALRAAAERSDAGRRDAARLACLESDLREAVRLGSRLRTRDTARDTRGRRRVLRLCCPAAEAFSALLRLLVLVRPLLGGERSTPARRALERPIAMACCGDLAPCSPRRILWISSRTNSPACVVGAFP